MNNIIPAKVSDKLMMVSFFILPPKKRVGYVRMVVIRTEIFAPGKYGKIIPEKLKKH